MGRPPRVGVVRLRHNEPPCSIGRLASRLTSYAGPLLMSV
jgi:hypothetical protein